MFWRILIRLRLTKTLKHSDHALQTWSRNQTCCSAQYLPCRTISCTNKSGQNAIFEFQDFLAQEHWACHRMTGLSNSLYALWKCAVRIQFCLLHQQDMATKCWRRVLTLDENICCECSYKCYKKVMKWQAVQWFWNCLRIVLVLFQFCSVTSQM